MRVTKTLLRLATATITVVVASGLALTTASAAEAEVVSGPTPGVSSSCSTLTVKPKGFVDKGEVRVVVDGEVQTDGSAQRDSTGDDWRVFKGSFPGVYDFDPRVTHRYSVEVNSWGGDSDGRSFTPGRGSDLSVTGTTTPCSPVALRVTPTNCTSPSRVDKQGLDLTVGALRRSTTYLVEVSSGGAVVKHFQFRTQPEISKHFSGLTAGRDYDVRVTDQSDDSLSTTRQVAIPGCAARVGLRAAVSECAADGSTRTVTADVDSLVEGRGYDLALTSETASALPVVSFVGDGASHSVAFSGVSPGSYRLSVSDDAAPRTTRTGPIVVASCSAAPGSSVPPVSSAPPGSSAPDPGATAPVTGPGSGSSGGGGASGSSAGGSSGGGTAGSTASHDRSPGLGASWASHPAQERASVVAVSADGSPVAVARPGHRSAPRPGSPAAVAAPSRPAPSPLVAALLWTGGGLAAVGAGGGALLLRRRVLARPGRLL